MKCPTCGANAQGKFCAECGSPLEASKCTSCKARLEPGATYCTQCGQRVRRAASQNLIWYLAGTAVVGLIIVLLVPTLRTGEDDTPSTTGAPQPGTPPPLSANMRENADRLFNRVMESRQAGDSAAVKQFAPMAIMAYENSGPLDADGMYHLSVLQLANGDPASARASADQILQAAPSHLLGLAAAASAAATLNDTAGARQYYQRFIDVLPAERTRDLPEYQDHVRLLPDMEAEARNFLKK